MYSYYYFDMSMARLRILEQDGRNYYYTFVLYRFQFIPIYYTNTNNDFPEYLS